MAPDHLAGAWIRDEARGEAMLDLLQATVTEELVQQRVEDRDPLTAADLLGDIDAQLAGALGQPGADVSAAPL
jgi:hypothetical protein